MFFQRKWNNSSTEAIKSYRLGGISDPTLDGLVLYTRERALQIISLSIVTYCDEENTLRYKNGYDFAPSTFFK